jgi:hypothetical protein
MNETRYVVVKLVSGENVMSILDYENSDLLELKYPMLIRSVQTVDNGIGKEHMIATPFCPFAADDYFTIERKDVMFVKELHQALVPNYLNLLKDHEQVVVRRNTDGSVSQVDKPLRTVEEFKERVDKLASLLGIDPVEDQRDTFYVEGTESIN